MVADRFGIDFGYDEGDIWVGPECGGIVDDAHAVVGEFGCPLSADACAGGEEGEVGVLERVAFDDLDGVLFACEMDDLSRGARRSEELAVLEGEVSVLENALEFVSDGSGCTDDGDVHSGGSFQ